MEGLERIRRLIGLKERGDPLLFCAAKLICAYAHIFLDENVAKDYSGVEHMHITGGTHATP